mmetsp:Transcript_97890/g.277456  ORF Transcript_97890/g.277456 Transcript_97890/m.277456 type:complete len:217 (-) Transcript_97890:240-890(-)
MGCGATRPFTSWLTGALGSGRFPTIEGKTPCVIPEPHLRGITLDQLRRLFLYAQTLCRADNWTKMGLDQLRRERSLARSGSCGSCDSESDTAPFAAQRSAPGSRASPSAHRTRHRPRDLKLLAHRRWDRPPEAPRRSKTSSRRRRAPRPCSRTRGRRSWKDASAIMIGRWRRPAFKTGCPGRCGHLRNLASTATSEARAGASRISTRVCTTRQVPR